MAKNYKIVFKSLRTGRTYTVHIGGGSGAEVELKGGASPFMTQEDNNEDFFTPVRTQSGYLRVMDDGFAADGVTAFDWKDLLPSASKERYVTLIDENDDTLWQGYIQAQNFSGTLYGGTQEREFPIQCGVSAMEGTMIDNTGDMKNFAYLIYSLFYDHDASIQYTHFGFQGGADAKSWLLTMVDWRNFTKMVSGDIVAKYTKLQVLQDVCRFWGWTCRTEGTQVFFSCMDDAGERNNWVSFTAAQMRELTDSTVGSTGSTGNAALSCDIFVSMNNDETLIRGIKRATLKVDVNPDETVFKFAPEDLEEEMGEPTTWVGDRLVGYYKTNTFRTLYGHTMDAYAPNASGGFERRSLYESSESDTPRDVDVILIRNVPAVSPFIMLSSKQPMAYGGGSLSFSGSFLQGEKSYTPRDNGLLVKIGIGLTRNTAQWFYLRWTDATHQESGWSSDMNNAFKLATNGSSITGAYGIYTGSGTAIVLNIFRYHSIPVANNLYGYLYCDIYGIDGEDNFEISDFTISYSRETTTIPADGARSRTIKKELPTSKEYSADNSGVLEEQWEEYTIFATDNGLEYGRGLIIGSNGSFVETVQYGGSSVNQQHPEQHLVNRIANFMQHSKRVLNMELRKGAGQVDAIMPMNTVTHNGKTYFTLAVGHEWRDDVKKVSLIEM